MSELKIPKKSTRIDLDFFKRHADEVAIDLLGMIMVRERAGKPTIYVRLEEIAAYEGKVKSMTEGSLEYPGTIGISTKHGKNLIDISTLDICEYSCVTLIAGIIFDSRGFRDYADGPGNLAKALEIDKTYNGVLLNFARIWIGGNSIEKNRILKRNKSRLPKNCKGFFYYK